MLTYLEWSISLITRMSAWVSHRNTLQGLRFVDPGPDPQHFGHGNGDALLIIDVAPSLLLFPLTWALSWGFVTSDTFKWKAEINLASSGRLQWTLLHVDPFCAVLKWSSCRKRWDPTMGFNWLTSVFRSIWRVPWLWGRMRFVTECASCCDH